MSFSRIVDAVTLHVEGARRDTDPDVVVLAIGAAELVVRIAARDAPRAHARFDRVSVSYEVRGVLGERSGEARDRALEIFALVRASEHERLSDALRRSAVADHLARVRAWWTQEPGATSAYPPCLIPALRPPFPALASPTIARGRPCAACASSSTCASAVPPDVAITGVRPLRHSDRTSAVQSALQLLAETFGDVVPPAIDAFVRDRDEAMRDEDAAPTPFELSIKIRGARIDRALRIVEYAPVASRLAEPRAIRARRNARVRRTAERFARDDTKEALHAWMDRFAGPEVESSVGLEVPLGAADEPSVQIYLHLDPGERDAMRSHLRGALAWAGVDARALPPLVGEEPVLTLLCLSPSAGDPRRIKLYFTVPIDPTALGELAPFAPSTGLVVIAIEAGRVVVHKRDFPNVVHYQSDTSIADALGAGLASSERAKLDTLLTGERFAPWPTWLSVGEGVRTFYFVPR